ncbi:DUF421 domain-containing protein [Virgibacillus kekensis]|uniref:DUF421 domain-containing protein n=1 Tax=Virgibacillus kekensis TaxID=202261 RepID=UPI003AA81404
MDFFSNQHSLTAIEWALRAVIGFIFLVILAKIMGQRSISQLRFMDFIVALMIGNIIAHPLSDPELGLKGSMVTMGVIVALYVVGIYISLKWLPVRKFFNPPPLPLIEYGKINYKNLKKAKISVNVLLSELRKKKTDDIQKVALALWEHGGTISIFLYPQYEPITRETENAPLKLFYLPKTVIVEGRIDPKELELVGKDESWLIQELKTKHNITPDNVLLATLGDNQQLKVYPFN